MKSKLFFLVPLLSYSIVACKEAPKPITNYKSSLTQEDIENLSDFYMDFDKNQRNPSMFPKFFDKNSLNQYMILHKKALGLAFELYGEKDASKAFHLNQPLQQVLVLNDSSDYFSNFKPKQDVLEKLEADEHQRSVYRVFEDELGVTLISKIVQKGNTEDEKSLGVWETVKSGEKWKFIVPGSWYYRLRHKIDIYNERLGRKH